MNPRVNDFLLIQKKKQKSKRKNKNNHKLKRHVSFASITELIIHNEILIWVWRKYLKNSIEQWIIVMTLKNKPILQSGNISLWKTLQVKLNNRIRKNWIAESGKKVKGIMCLSLNSFFKIRICNIGSLCFTVSFSNLTIFIFMGLLNDRTLYCFCVGASATFLLSVLILLTSFYLFLLVSSHLCNPKSSCDKKFYRLRIRSCLNLKSFNQSIFKGIRRLF